MSRQFFRQTRTATGAAISEFGYVLFVFFIIILFPCINIIMYSVGASTVQAISTEACRAATSSESKTDAINLARNKTQAILNTGLAQCVRVVPQGVGIPTTGCRLEVLRSPLLNPALVQTTDVSNGQAIPAAWQPVDTQTFLYQYRVTANYNVNPFLNMAGIPFVGQIPGVGAPGFMQYTSTGQVENAAGLIR